MPKAAAAARKRRKEKLQTSRGAGGANDMEQVELAAELPPEMNAAAEAAAVDDDDDDDDIAVPAANAKKQTKCTKTGKSMNTYEPDVEMTKEQLTAWRREARRVRNRESAATSRMKTKNRITELEEEVNDYKSKYEAALQKLAEYEAEAL